MRSKKDKLLFVIAVVAAVGFGGAFVYNAYSHINYWLDARTAREDTAVMQDIFAEQMEFVSMITIDRDRDGQAQSEAAESTEEAVVMPSFASPFATAREVTGNDDIMAYIHIEGTNISNVVLQGTDNIFYLNRDMHRQANVNGSLFLDFENSPDFTDRNSVIYGHNMRNGTMFHDLRYFMGSDYFDANRYIVVVTEREILTYEIFSAFSTRTDFEYIQIDFYDDEDYLQLLNEMRRRSVHEQNIPVYVNDRILILSTCTNTAQDMRFVVAGVLRTRDVLS